MHQAKDANSPVPMRSRSLAASHPHCAAAGAPTKEIIIGGNSEKSAVCGVSRTLNSLADV
jgi:hypothetical protein